jgi:hypothetical protein
MELEISESRISGSRYHTVHPIFSWDLAGDWGGVDTWTKMEDWCFETFGLTPKDGVWTPNARWYINNGKFWFRTEKDLSWFVLRWA